MQISLAGGAGRILAAVALGISLCAALPLAAQPVGSVIHVQGIASAQKPGEPARFLQKGDPLLEGDVLNTTGRGYAVIELKDGSKMTLRPDTTFAISEYKEGTASDGMLLRVLKGGMRAVTGLIAKRNPSSVRVNAGTATIGIRGTSFDARLCGADCGQEGRQGDKPAISLAQQEAIVARIAASVGAVQLVGTDGQTRTAVRGAQVLTGETVRTQRDAYAVVAFRDRTVVTVPAESEFKLENVRFSLAQPESDSFLVRVVKGGARALTGALGKRNPNAVKFNIGTATIGIRGTGLDGRFSLDCVSPGACNEAAFVHVWDGSVSFEAGGQSIVVDRDRAAVHNPARDRFLVLDAVPAFFLTEAAPRPDGLQVDFENLFGTESVPGTPPGFYVLMREGHIELADGGRAVDLGPGDSGYLAEGRAPIRLTITPTFMLFDPMPLPDRFDPNSVRLIDLLNMGGKPGDAICEM